MRVPAKYNSSIKQENGYLQKNELKLIKNKNDTASGIDEDKRRSVINNQKKTRQHIFDQ